MENSQAAYQEHSGPSLSRVLQPTQARWVAVLLLLLFFARLTDSAARSSATFDEPLHLFGSAGYWQLQPLQPIIDNPLLIHALIGLPQQLIFNPTLPTDHQFWGEQFASLALSSAFLWESNESGPQMLWTGRLIVMIFALLTGALLYGWSRRWSQATAPALATLLLFTFDPNVLAHGSLATTDMGTVFFVCLATLMFRQYWRHRGWALYLAAGVALGLAVSSKFSGTALIIAVAPMALYQGWRGQKTRGLWHSAIQIVGWLALAAFVLLAVERFDLTLLTRSLQAVRGAQEFGHPTYLFGEVNQGGWWYYFPVLFLAKTPLPTLLLLAAAVALPLLQRRFDWQQAWLLLVVIAWLGAALTSSINLGYRHLLPVLPLLYLQVGLLVSPENLAGRYRPRLLAAAFVTLTIISLLAHPNYLAYFNLLAGGPENGQRIAVDSNLDWGQDLSALANYVQENGVHSLNTALFSTTPPGVYGILANQLPAWPDIAETNEHASYYPARPAAGSYAISATHLKGVYLDDVWTFSYFQQQQPVGRAGYSIFIYELPPDGPLTSVALSGIELPEVSSDGYDATIATNNIILRWYDARSSLVWAPADASWSIVGAEHLPDSDLLSRLYPQPTRTDFANTVGQDGFRANYFHWSDSPFANLALSTPEAIDGRQGRFQQVEQTESGQTESGQAESGQFATLVYVGHTSLAKELIPGSTVELLTVWRLIVPPEKPMAIYLHLLDASGAIVAQYDGWDVALDGLSTGDEVGQLLTLPMPASLAAGDYTLKMGIYDLASGQRYQIATPEGIEDGLIIGTFSLGSDSAYLEHLIGKCRQQGRLEDSANATAANLMCPLDGRPKQGYYQPV